MRIIEVLEARRWRNLETNEERVTYGSSQTISTGWILESVGYTWRMSTGTLGFGRPPVATWEEAETVMRLFNARQPIQW